MRIQTFKALNKLERESKILSCDMANVLVATKAYAILSYFYHPILPDSPFILLFGILTLLFQKCHPFFSFFSFDALDS
jgi:hypothetical protein